MRRIQHLAFAVLLLFTLAPVCLGQLHWETTLVASGGHRWRGNPRIYGDHVYYGAEDTSGLSSVYRWTKDQGSVRLLGGDGIWRRPEAVWEDKVVVNRYVNNQLDLWLYDPVNGETAITAAAGDQYEADIYGSTVVYEDRSGTYSQVMIWDEVNGERILSPASANQTVPKIYGDRVVYQENGGVWMWTPTTGATRLATGRSPVIYGDKIVYFYPATSDPYGFYPGNIMQWTPSGGFQSLAPWYDYGGAFEVDMSDTLVAWSLGDPRYASTYDPAHGVRLLADMTPAMIGSVYGNSVAWVGSYNVYLSTLVPEPSGLIALSSFGGVFSLLCLRRRRKQ